MKRSITIITLALVACMATAQNSNGILQKSEGSITFVVDEDLKPIEDDYPMEESLKSGAFALYGILRDEGVPGDTHAIIARSFSDDEYFYTFTGKDVFFQTVVRAYAEHRPLVLSPDMIWVLISQGFARYVDAHAEEMRDMLVSHTDKMMLTVRSDKELLTEEANWEEILSDFTASIHENTKGDIAKTITADFSTTGVTERITSQITLMETMKNYFDYIVVYLACGIPNITLKGTPDDWQKVLDKTQQLEQYGMTEWIKSLKPILKEFVRASNGNPNQKFWKNMVKKNDPNKLIGGGCDFREPTQLDGWILKFFPNENGVTLYEVAHTESMPSERVYVDFKYQIIDIADGSIKLETPLQLIAGFIGTEVDKETRALTPKMGWVVRQMENDDVILKKLVAKDNEQFSDGIQLRVRRVPDFLSDLPHIKKLRLEFTDEVVLPEWFYNLQIDELTISGEMSKEVQASISKYFPRVVFRIPPKRRNNDEPMIIVDGVRFHGKLSEINPDDIQTKTVLKDAAATAIYGTQGANGVIEITTKSNLRKDAPLKESLPKPKSAIKEAPNEPLGTSYTISGVVRDDKGPLMGATVCEIDENGRIIEATITDNNGKFTLKFRNKNDKVRISYVGCKTVTLDYQKKKYNVLMKEQNIWL